MRFKDQLFETLKKKALGFSYVEETAEYETMRPKNYLFCERRRRLYSAVGFIKVIPKNGGVEVKHKKIALKPVQKLKNMIFMIKS